MWSGLWGLLYKRWPISVTWSSTMSPCVFSILVILWPVMAVEMSTLEGQQILQALHCPPCERIHCSPRPALKLQCQGGITTGICGCCLACAKLAGESCGGTWDYLGKCDEGLVCIYPEETGGKPEAQRKGTCKSGTTEAGDVQLICLDVMLNLSLNKGSSLASMVRRRTLESFHSTKGSLY